MLDVPWPKNPPMDPCMTSLWFQGAQEIQGSDNGGWSPGCVNDGTVVKPNAFDNPRRLTARSWKWTLGKGGTSIYKPSIFEVPSIYKPSTYQHRQSNHQFLGVPAVGFRGCKNVYTLYSYINFNPERLWWCLDCFALALCFFGKQNAGKKISIYIYMCYINLLFMYVSNIQYTCACKQSSQVHVHVYEICILYVYFYFTCSLQESAKQRTTLIEA